ncbi:MAG: hypothetical protein WCC48_05615 [Anaeromyxobacteraceae bacterium]
MNAALIETEGVAPAACEAVTAPSVVESVAQAPTVTVETETAGLPVTPSASEKVA